MVLVADQERAIGAVAGSRKAEVRATRMVGREKQNQAEATLNPKL